MTTKIRLLGLSLTVLLASCGSQTPATPGGSQTPVVPVNPVGTWSGTEQAANESGPVEASLVVTEVSKGVYEGTFQDPGIILSGLDCKVSDARMTCSGTLISPDPTDDSTPPVKEPISETFSFEGPISETSYTGDATLLSSVTSEIKTATFDLSRPAQP